MLASRSEWSVPCRPEMSNGTPTLQQRMNVAVFSAGGARLKAETINDDGSAVYKGVPIFRSGTFRDSIGIQHTYEPEHMEQIVFNYDLLKGRGLLTPVVRADHSVSVKNVMGYFDAVTTNKVGDRTFVLVDFTVNDADEVKHIESGKYRFRSAEIGYYETNDEALYWPVCVGFAFVDMPAVEGLDAGYAANLDGYSRQSEQHFSLRPANPVQEDTDMGDTPQPHKFTLRGVQTDDYTAVQAELDRAKDLTGPAAPHAFRVSGAECTDPSKVQAHINQLEAFRTQLIKEGKDAFVKGLVDDKKILATEHDGFRAHVEGLDGPAYDAFRALYSKAPDQPLLAHHGAGKADGTDTPIPGSREVEQKEIDEEIVADFRRSGMSEDAISKTEAFRRLQTASA